MSWALSTTLELRERRGVFVCMGGEGYKLIFINDYGSVLLEHCDVQPE